MIVELFGPPGVGKSTLARATVAALRQRGLPAQLSFPWRRAWPWLGRQLGSVPELASLTLTRPNDVVTAQRAIRASTQASSGDHLKVLHNWLAVCAHMRHLARKPQLTLFDEGVFQALWSVLYCAKSPDADAVTSALLKTGPKADLVVLVAATPEIIYARLSERAVKESRFERRGKLDGAALMQLLALFDIVTAVIRQETPAERLLELSNHTLELAVDALTQAAVSRYRSPVFPWSGGRAHVS